MTGFLKRLPVLMAFGILLVSCASKKNKESATGAHRLPITIDKEMRISQIQEDVYVATDLKFYNSNILVVRMKDGTVVLASSPYENVGTRRLINWVNSQLKPTKVVAINTHFHADGTAGNQVYHENGVETWATKMTAHFQMTEGKKILPLMIRGHEPEVQQRILHTKYEEAKNLFSAREGKTFDFSGQKVQVYYPGEAHSPDNVVVYIPSKKTMFGGCMVKPKKLGWLKHANVEAWERSARNLLQFDVEYVIPGHGKWGDRSLLEKTVAVAKKAAADPKVRTKDFH